MAELEPQYIAILKRILEERFVPFLPPLLGAARPEDQAVKQLSRAFSAFALHKLLSITPQEAAASVVDDFNDNGIDAVHYDAPSETLYLLQTKLKEQPFRQEDAQPFCEGVRLLLRQNFGGFNENVQIRRAQIEAALDICSHIKLVVPFVGDGVSDTADRALQALLDQESGEEERLVSQVEYYSADEIKRDILAENAFQPVHTTIELLKHSKVEEPRVAYYGIARLTDLVSLHNAEGKALYERNIRYFLGSGRSDVNKAIKETLHRDPQQFFYLSNGVTAVCDQIELRGRQAASGFRKFRVRGLSIINGAQTVASAAEYIQQNPESTIDGAKVMFTVIKATADGQFGKEVTRARNHQNPVQTVNFASLDENQERLRQEIAHSGFEYHYRSESVPTSATAITIEEAVRALALLQDDPRYPVWLKSEPARLADPDSDEYRALFYPSLPGATVINAVLCARAIRPLIVAHEQNAPARSQERLIYRHGLHVMMAVTMKRLRSRVKAVTILDAEELPNLISRPVDDLRQQIFDLVQPQLVLEGPLAYFRRHGSVAACLTDLMETHFSLTADPAVQPLRNIQNSADEAYPRKRLIDYLSSRAPQL